MHRILLAVLALPLLCAWGCSQTVNPHALFVHDNGGVDPNPARVARADAAVNRLRSGLELAPNCHLHTFILHNNACCAYSFSDGTIYLSAALVDRLSEDELAAVIAHEIGHMVHDRVVSFPDAEQHVALLGQPGINGEQLEITADALGRRLLLEHHVPPESLPDALSKLIQPSASYYHDLLARIAILRAADR